VTACRGDATRLYVQVHEEQVPKEVRLTAQTDRIEAHVWRIGLVVIIESIMSILDTTIVNVALKTLSRDFHASLAQIHERRA
jgi:hypothetical protein